MEQEGGKGGKGKERENSVREGDTRGREEKSECGERGRGSGKKEEKGYSICFSLESHGATEVKELTTLFTGNCSLRKMKNELQRVKRKCSASKFGQKSIVAGNEKSHQIFSILVIWFSCSIFLFQVLLMSLTSFSFYSEK